MQFNSITTKSERVLGQNKYIFCAEEAECNQFLNKSEFPTNHLSAITVLSTIFVRPNFLIVNSHT